MRYVDVGAGTDMGEFVFYFPMVGGQMRTCLNFFNFETHSFGSFKSESITLRAGWVGM